MTTQTTQGSAATAHGTEWTSEFVKAEDRRPSWPLYALAFGWGFLPTGLIAGAAVSAGLPFWPDAVLAMIAGNTIMLAVGLLTGWIGYDLGANNAIVLRYVFGQKGAQIPGMLMILILIGWAGIVNGLSAFVWAHETNSALYYILSFAFGILFTVTTYYGIKSIERIAMPSMIVLVLVSIYVIYYTLSTAGGFAAFNAQSALAAATNSLTFAAAVKLVVGSWIVGALVQSDYSRFCRTTGAAAFFIWIVLWGDQLFLQTLGAFGGVTQGSYDFTGYLAKAGPMIGLIAQITMFVALWTTADANLYLPAQQFANSFKTSFRTGVVVTGLVATVLGPWIFQRFINWIDFLAALFPALAGPIIADYFIINRMKYRQDLLPRLPAWNAVGLVAWIGGVLCGKFLTPVITPWLPEPLMGIIASGSIYLVLYYVFAAAGQKFGYAGIAAADSAAD